MTPDELKRLIASADREVLCAALAPLDEPSRLALSNAAVSFFQQVDGAWSAIVFAEANRDELVAAADPELIQSLTGQKYTDWRVPRMAAGLAVVALCERKILEKPFSHGLSSWFVDDIRDMPQRVLQILDARRPKWLADWIAKDKQLESPVLPWFVERGLIRSGAIPPNHDEEYIRRMARDFSACQATSIEVTTDNLPVVYRSHEELLLADPDLLKNEVWRLFEVETNAFEFWGETLRTLSSAGHLDRQRLLRVSLRAMSLPFRPNAVSAYGKFHESLEPTLDEKVALVGEYLGVLSCDQPFSVGIALDALESLAKAKRLDASSYLAACPTVFRIAKKTQPAKALKLAKLLLKQQPACGAAAAQAVSAGVGHALQDIQEQSLDVLESLQGQLSDELRQELARWLDSVAAACRPRLESLVATAAATAASPQPVEAARKKTPRATPPEPNPLGTRAAALAAVFRSLSGVDATLQALEQETDPPPIMLDSCRIPRRDPARRVAPLAAVDELIDTVARVIEKPDDVLDLERILDGISRFHAAPPDDFARRVAPLRKRIEKLSEPYSGTFLDTAADIGFAQVLRAWLGLPPIQREWGSWHDMRGWFLRCRTTEIVWRIEAGKSSLPVLALPTHRGGWIDPVVLVERINTTYEAEGELIGNYDLAQALLRLTPDGRDEALQRLREPSHYNGGRTLRYALGDDIELASWGGLGEDELLLAAQHARAVVQVPAPTRTQHPVGGVALHADGTLIVSGPVTQDPAMPSDLLTYVFSRRCSSAPRLAWEGKRQWITDWESLIWPLDPRPDCLMGRLSRLLERDVNWGDEAARLAAFATSAEDAEVRTLISDALIEAIGEFRIDPALLGKYLARHVELLKLNRTSAVLTDVARTSWLHQWAVFRIVEEFIARLEAIPRDVHVMLTPLLESATVIGRKPGIAAERVLRQLTGANKAAKLAKQLTEVPEDSRKWAAIRIQACEACLARAERWQALTRESPQAGRGAS